MEDKLPFPQRFAKFAKKNLVLLTMVPVIIGLHVGWSLLQKVEKFVPKHEQQIELPIIRGAKTLAEITNLTTSEKKENK